MERSDWKERRGKRSVRRGYDQVQSVISVVSRKVCMLSQNEGGKESEKRRDKIISSIIGVNVEIASYYKLHRVPDKKGPL